MNDFLDPKIKPLVEVLNSYKGIETFSSCEGHGNSIPFVTFCLEGRGAGQSLEALFGRLKKRSRWKIILGDKASSEKGIVCTLRYVQEDLSEVIPLEDVQKEIPTVARMLSRKHAEFSPKTIENNFPVLKCPICGSENFSLNFCVTADLTYDYHRYPKLTVDRTQNPGTVQCLACEEFIQDEYEVDQEEILSIIIQRLERQPGE